jgi:hypothetical protein
MTIKFVEGRENGYLEYFAISQLEKYKGKVYDELMWAEITPGIIAMKRRAIGITPSMPEEAFIVIWEDDWQNKLVFTTLEEAKQHIIKNFHKHVPHNNGKIFEED